MLKMRHSLIFFILFYLFAGPLNAKVLRCEALLAGDGGLSNAIHSLQSVNTDTTSLRQEVKFVVKTADLNAYLPRVADFFQARMKNRDQAPVGYSNVTSTYYMPVAKYYQNGKKLSAKVRFRKYYTHAISDPSLADLKVIPELAERSWLELKIQHPVYDNVVFKPRLLVSDKDIEILINRKFIESREGVIQRLKELNPGKQDLVQKFIDYFDALHSVPKKKKENMYAHTQYDRTSYSIKLNNPISKEDKIDIQITLDQNIHLTRIKDQQHFDVYSPDETVVEVKVPLKYSQLSDANLREVPELGEIKKLIEFLNRTHVEQYPKNKGKMSKIENDEEMEDINEIQNDWD